MKVQCINNTTTKNESCIICRDFNLVLDPDLDYDNYKHLNNIKSRNKVLELIQDQHLIDTFRELNPDTRRYSWRKNKPFYQSHLDLILISEDLFSSLNSASILPGHHTDHSIATISLKFYYFEKGKDLWKMNSALLSDKDYLDQINNLISSIVYEYALPVYDIDYIKNYIIFTINDQLFLETLLVKIRGQTIAYAPYKQNLNNTKEQTLMSEIEALEKKFE